MGSAWVPTLDGNVAEKWQHLAILLAPALKMMTVLRERMEVRGAAGSGGGALRVARGGRGWCRVM